MAFAIVVLPEPDSPTIECIDPGLIEKLISSTALIKDCFLVKRELFSL